MTDAQVRANKLAEKLRHAVMNAPVDIGAAEAMALPLAAALAQVEAETWEKAAQFVESGHFLSDESLEYKFGRQCAAGIRQQAQRAKETT